MVGGQFWGPTTEVEGSRSLLLEPPLNCLMSLLWRCLNLSAGWELVRFPWAVPLRRAGCVCWDHSSMPLQSLTGLTAPKPFSSLRIIWLLPGCPFWSQELQSHCVSKARTGMGFEIPDKGKRDYDPFVQRPR